MISLNDRQLRLLRKLMPVFKEMENIALTNKSSNVYVYKENDEWKRLAKSGVERVKR